MKAHSQQRANQGFALIAVLATVLILTGVVTGLSKIAFQNMQFAFNSMMLSKASFAAEAAVDAAAGMARANPDQRQISGEITPYQEGRETITGSYQLSRVRASRFGDSLKGIDPTREVLWVRASGEARRGENYRRLCRVRAILLPVQEDKFVRTLVWTEN
ncbi:MAG TPA: hypothetical protein PKH07_02920 [bacterium]|nr:hypothetical protein [bacterium]